ncbi:VirB3 family type IV secretion system protein [Yersinia enterocolitica]|nr:VirB3 family type IV secretion system protein [Yersinia enterocolitica]EKN4736353.1 VirB3 family type IV secretion system protein [Yersinia enterocolitica]CQJ44809.1 Uncharacterised protein [Yersinia enterocolitica]
MVTLNKALTRPAMLFGIPMVPLVIDLFPGSLRVLPHFP